MTLLNILSYITYAISAGAVVYFFYLTVPLVKAFYVVAKAEAEEEIRVKQAAELLEEVTKKAA